MEICLALLMHVVFGILCYTECVMKDTRLIEEKIARLFSIKKPFSEHLSKWEDDLLPDKHDSNCFEYSGQPTREEFERALAYQKTRGDQFLKFEGDTQLTDAFGMEDSITVTMVLKDRSGQEVGTTPEIQWKTNDSLSFRTPSIEELEEIVIKHYGATYGEDFTRRNIRRQYDKLEYHGAYIEQNYGAYGQKLVGVCHTFTADGMTCIDGLLVDEDYRKQYVAMSLMAHIRELYPDTTLFLHAGMDDTPKDMYQKMGFEITDYLYEYSR